MDECPHEDCFAPKIPCHAGEKTPSRCPIWTHRDDLQSASGEAGCYSALRERVIDLLINDVTVFASTEEVVIPLEKRNDLLDDLLERKEDASAE